MLPNVSFFFFQMNGYKRGNKKRTLHFFWNSNFLFTFFSFNIFFQTKYPYLPVSLISEQVEISSKYKTLQNKNFYWNRNWLKTCNLAVTTKRTFQNTSSCQSIIIFNVQWLLFIWMQLKSLKKVIDNQDSTTSIQKRTSSIWVFSSKNEGYAGTIETHYLITTVNYNINQ